MHDWNKYIREHLSPLGLKPERELEIVEELALHLETVYEDAITQGESEEEAARRVAAMIGDWQFLECEVAVVENSGASVWMDRRFADLEQTSHKGGFRMGSLLQDLRYGMRMLLKRPGFTVIAVLSLALGIGANTALFSLVDAVLLKTLPVKNPEELILFNWEMWQRGLWGNHIGILQKNEAAGTRIGSSFSMPAFLQFKRQSGSFSDLFAFSRVGPLTVKIDGRAEVISGQLVSGGYYQGLGVGPILGRAISAEDDRQDAAAVVVLSHRYWEHRFGLDPSVIGKTITVNSASFTIIGIAPPKFHGALQLGESPDLTLPMATRAEVGRGDAAYMDGSTWWVQIMGRLKPGMSAEQARAELEGVYVQNALDGWNALPPDRRPPDYAEKRDLPRLQLIPGGQGLMNLREEYRRPLTLLTIVVGITLLIACANIANLLLARAAGRRQEIALRSALGAGRSRLVRQLLTESLLLSVFGGALGWLLAWCGKDILLTWNPWGGNRPEMELQLNWRVLGFTMAVSLFASLLFGLAPALQAASLDLNTALKTSARGTRGSLSVLGKSLVVLQAALSVVLLVGAGLFLRTLHNLRSVDLGFNAENLLLFILDPRPKGYKGDDIVRLYDRMIEGIEATPGVRSATLSATTLLSGGVIDGPAYPHGREPLPFELSIVNQQRVRWNFCETMEIPLLVGRNLRPQDDSNAPKVAVINQTMARRFFGDENPIGKRFGFGKDENGQIEVVGVVRDTKVTGLRPDAPSTAYIPYQQKGPGPMTFEVRTEGDSGPLIAAIREAIRRVDPDLPLTNLKTQIDQSEERLINERFFAKLIGFFGALALLLACIGLYGVMAHSVAQRTHEIAVRMSLGATPGSILKNVLGQGMSLVFVGLVLGAAASLWLNRLIDGFLFQVSATDPLTFGAISILLVATALAACFLPARRATAVDPMIALRID
jgi:predicted permease